MAELPQQAWVFNARAIRVVDGDTIDLCIDQGMHNTRTERVRLLGINCPEVHGPSKPAGMIATEFTHTWLQTAAAGDVPWPLRIQTVRSDAFGRYLTTVWRLCDGACLNEALLESGNAVPFMV